MNDTVNLLQWAVWRVYYTTYEEMRQTGDLDSIQVTNRLYLQDAMKRAEELGFGYCVKPWDSSQGVTSQP